MNEELRIGVVHWAFPPVIGGVEMHLLTIAPEMARQGAEVFLLAGTAEGAPATEEMRGITVERREGMVPGHVEDIRERGGDVYAASKRTFETFLDAHAVNVVQAHNLHYDLYALSHALEDACRERGIPFYLVLHNDLFLDRSRETTRRIVEEIGWHRLVAISHYIRDQMAPDMDVPQERWTVIMHGIDTGRFTPMDEEQKLRWKREYGFGDRPVILHPARFLPWKGVLPALHAMPRVVESVPDALMVMTGRAERIYKDQEALARYDDRIDAYIEAQGLGENVYVGDYDHDDIPRLEALSDVVVYTTIGDEPFGLVPVEGMACGVPVVVTRSGGMVESVVDGETGFIISKEEERMPGELAERVTWLLTHPQEAGEMGQRGRERAVETFAKERMARDFLELSQQLRKGAETAERKGGM